MYAVTLATAPTADKPAGGFKYLSTYSDTAARPVFHDGLRHVRRFTTRAAAFARAAAIAAVMPRISDALEVQPLAA